ncbi:MAG TPA: N-acetylglucosamine-specific PTS transporter subunit IIBC [Candidatus Treponema faecavium]|nr:N-acetylglucosamine-specific PTS transporter subunit IIBC [Candidatus Treponema faecavium]
MMQFFQKLGRALMLPVAVLPAAAILMGIGYWIDPSGWGANNAVAAFLLKAGGAIIDNLPWLFAVGVAIGMAKGQDGAAALSGLVAMFIVTTILSPASVAMLKQVDAAEVPAAFGKITNAFTGIISGLVAAAVFNKFHTTQLPAALSFFSGKRCTPIITSAFMIVVSVILFFLWPAIYGVLVSFGEGVAKLGPIGAAIYAFFNRLLIPTGLHHALNSVFWFDGFGINDIGNFWAGTGTKGVTGMYQGGFFPVMMFGLPGAALAMYQTAKPNKKKTAGGLLLAAAFASFFTGVTEPLEFSFMFLAPGLYVVHAALTAVSVGVAAALHATAGFSFSAGLVDFVLSSRLPLANNPWILLIMGVVFFVIYYVLFRVLIVNFNLKTPGREDDDDEVSEKESKLTLSNSNFAEVAKAIYDAIGGKDNIVDIDNCTTRLRLKVKDSSTINEKAIKAAGAHGVIRPSKDAVQVIVGTQVEFVATEMKKL